MTRQEEINEKASKYSEGIILKEDAMMCKASYEQGANWADKTMIETAINWLALNAEMYGGFNHGKLNEMVEDFKKAMEE